MSAFIIKVKTDNAGTSNSDQFTLPGNSSYSYNFDVDWGDGSPVETINSGSSWTHTFTGGAGTYSVEITENVAGGFPTIRFNNSGDRLKLLEIEQWGTNRWDTFKESFYGCSNLTITATDEATADTGGVLDFYAAWRGCSSLTSFPLIDTSSGTNFASAWYGCSSLTSFPLIDTSSGTEFNYAWYRCSSIASFPLINTSSGTDFGSAWDSCGSMTSFPLIDTSSGTNFGSAWRGCSSLTSFPLIDTSSGTNFGAAWSGCSSLTSFPLIDTSSGTNFNGAWYNCSSLTSFPLIDTSSGTNFALAWYNCSSLTSFPLINTSSGTNFSYAWVGCSSLTSFPLINTSIGTNLVGAWQSCSSLTSFPLLDTSSGTSFNSAWRGCSSLTSFPLINTSSGTNFRGAWENCSSLTSFPLIDTSSGTDFRGAWENCSSLTSFPLIDTSSGTNFGPAWRGCSSLTSFPLINTSSGTNFSYAWRNCSSLTSFPLLDFRAMSNGTNTFFGVTLDTASYDAILEKSFLNNTNNGVTFHGGNSKYARSGLAARDILTAAPRSWTITDGGYDSVYDPLGGVKGWWCPSRDTAGNGTTTLTDLSGNGNNGTLTNMDAATDWVADTDNGGVRALDFDGINDYVEIADTAALRFSTAFTISTWVKLTSPQAQFASVFSKYQGGVNNRNYALLASYYGGNKPALLYMSDGGTFNSNNYVESSVGYTSGGWTHVVARYSTTTVDIWLDGVKRGTDTNFSAPVDTSDEPVRIGTNIDAGTYLTGLVDAIGAWDRLLTDAEVSQLYNGGRSLNLLATGTSIVPQLLLCRRCRSPIL